MALPILVYLARHDHDVELEQDKPPEHNPLDTEFQLSKQVPLVEVEPTRTKNTQHDELMG